jgi:hypothetical protein
MYYVFFFARSRRYGTRFELCNVSLINLAQYELAFNHKTGNPL